MKKILSVAASILLSVSLLLSGCDTAGTPSTLPLLPDEGSSSYEVSSDTGSVGGTLSELPSSDIANESSSSEASSTASKSDSSSKNNSQSSATSSSSELTPVDKITIDFRGVWIQYTDSLFSNTNEELFKKTVTEKFTLAKESGFNAIILHVRSNADAAYRSSYFPFASSLTGTQGVDPGFDPLSVAVAVAHSLGLELHAWINPYRVSVTTDDVTKLCETNIARIWRTDGNPETDSYVIPWGGKVYFNPACAEVQRLVLDGIREILDNYDVDGIHFDDYFYPTADADFDIGSYAKYCRESEYPLSQGDWRRANVDTLVSAVYRLVKSYGKRFGISPAAPISSNNSDRNYNEYFINVKKWMTTTGYIDYIAPQLYFGYEHKLESTRFDVLIKGWTAVKRLPTVELYIGLAAYKIGLENNSDLREWITCDNILAKEYLDANRYGAEGIIIYNHSSFFSSQRLNTAQRENLLKVMNGE